MPYTGIVFAILAAFLGGFLILLSHWVAAAGLFPSAVKRLAATYDSRPVRATLVGILTYGPLQVIGLQAGNIPNGPLKLLAVLVGFGSLFIGLIGTAGLAHKIGRNLSPAGDPWQQSLRGGVMLALVFITPFLGWFFALPIGLASGFGAFILGKPWKKPAPEPAPAMAPEPVRPPALPAAYAETPALQSQPAPEPALS